MAIDIPEELITLERSAVDAERAALAEPYTEDGWAAWRDASAAFQAAITEHARTAAVNRFQLEQAVKKAVLHPEPGA